METIIKLHHQRHWMELKQKIIKVLLMNFKKFD